MFVRSQSQPGIFFDADDGGGGGFDSIDALAAATDPANQAPAPATPAAAEPPPPPAATPPAAAEPSGLPDPDAIPDDLRYRDAADLRKELAKSRTRWKPFEDGLSGLDDAQRAAYLESTQKLGGQAADVMSAFGGMHADDAGAMVELARSLTAGGDPADVAAKFDEIADYLRGKTGEPARQGGQNADFDDDDDVDDDDLPITRGELREQQMQAATREQERVIVDEARALGYDPLSNDSLERGRWANLREIALGLPDGDLNKAHEVLAAQEQKIIDRYLEGKTADAGRPGALNGTGASPTQEKPVVSLDDAADAMSARLDGALGARPSR